MKKIEFSTKGGVLRDLSKVVKKCDILPLELFTVSDYRLAPDKILSRIQHSFKPRLLVVRSSSAAEDCHEKSNAGRFKSILHIKSGIKKNISRAIEEVIGSYENPDPLDEVLVQPELEGISRCGVAFTADIDTLAPYYIINYEDGSGRSDIVTSGSAVPTKTYIHFKFSSFMPSDAKLVRVIEMLRELEKLFKFLYIDVEFAFDNKNTLYLFQARPIVSRAEPPDRLQFTDFIERIRRKLAGITKEHPDLLGKRSLLGVMPDWNPAEIIGKKPGKLALSLYKELVTDSIWAYQRDNYGYRALRSHPLLVSIGGIPFIDVRVDFNSFIPKNLHDSIADKLVNYYLKKLSDNPSLHDKVEFEIIHSCYYLNLPERMSRELLNSGFTSNEVKRIEFSLLELTNKIIDLDNGLFTNDMRKIESLLGKYDRIMDSELSPLDKIYWLVEDCKRYGTLPFAGAARAAFIAVQFLRSFVDTKLLKPDQYDDFLNSLNTVSKELSSDIYSVRSGRMAREIFLAKYGHLRPGTYDIMSPRYDEYFDEYFGVGSPEARPQKNGREFCFPAAKMRDLDRLLVQNGLKTNAEKLLRFIKLAVEGRERAKFIFTKSLSQILKILCNTGKSLGIPRNSMAHLDIRDILYLYSSLDFRPLKQTILKSIRENKELHDFTRLLHIPNLITNPDSIYGFFLESGDQPNFVTLKSASGETIPENKLKRLNAAGKIVLISSADPGYDFLFAQNIAGLVTEYGGMNSHMAIRCAELGIPAVIGAGEKLFKEWSKFRRLEIDCAEKTVRGII